MREVKKSGRSLKQTEICVNASISEVKNGFVGTGYYLGIIRSEKLWKEDGSASFNDYMKTHYQKDKSWASKCISVYDQFGVQIEPGELPRLREDYQNYDVSKLFELIYLPEEKREEVTPETSVRAIRELKPKKEQKVSTVETPDPEKLSAYGTSIKVYPVDSLIVTAGCNGPDGNRKGSHDCFSCHLQCGIRQQFCYCVEAPMGNPFPCRQISRINTLQEDIGERCQFVNPDLAYRRAGDQEPVPCCKDCKEPCQYACGRSVQKRETEEPVIKPEIQHACEEDHLPDENWNFGSLPQAKEKHIKSLARVLVEKKGKRLRYSALSSGLNEETIKWKLEELADETDRAIEIEDGVIAYPCAEIIEFARGEEDLGICSYARFGTQVRKAFEEWKARQDSEPESVRSEPQQDPVIDAEFEEVPEERPYTMDMVMVERLRWKDRRESSKPGGMEPSEAMYRKACMMYDAMLALHTSMGGEYGEIA